MGFIPSTLKTPTGILFFALGVNISLSILKIAWGHSIRSAGMLADGYHALLDSLSDLICLGGVTVARRPPDADHPYGHFKFEPLAQVAVGIFLLFTGYEVLSHSYESYRSATSSIFSVASVSVMVVSMGLQLLLVKLEENVVRETRNTLVKADALHIRYDLFASLSVIAGLVASHLGYPKADPIVGFLIAIMIGKAGYELMRDGTRVLSDWSPLDPEAITQLALETPGVLGCRSVRSRGTESRIYMDLNLHVNDNLTVVHAHSISHDVEKRIKNKYPSVIEVIVHIEPFCEEKSHAHDTNHPD